MTPSPNNSLTFGWLFSTGFVATLVVSEGILASSNFCGGTFNAVGSSFTLLYRVGKLGIQSGLTVSQIGIGQNSLSHNQR